MKRWREELGIPDPGELEELPVLQEVSPLDTAVAIGGAVESPEDRRAEDLERSTRAPAEPGYRPEHEGDCE